MAKLPRQVAELYHHDYFMTPLVDYLEHYGFRRIHQGKVRDSYALPRHKGYRLVVATDRISIFDFVLPALVPHKGEVLTALTHFWLNEVLSDFPHHLIYPFCKQPLPIDHPTADEIAHEMSHELPVTRCLVVREVVIPPYEMIFRGHVGGSIWKQYQQSIVVAGQQLPAGLKKWHRLEKPLFTPSTKSQAGHDVNITIEEYFEQMGEAGYRSVKMFERAYIRANECAQEQGILILDTKFEGLDVIADEVLTPDSSRFTTVDDYQKALEERRDPVFYDKQLVRDWGLTVETPLGRGTNQLNPEDDGHVAFVHGLKVPHEIINKTSQRYLEIFERLTGQSLKEYQEAKMVLEA